MSIQFTSNLAIYKSDYIFIEINNEFLATQCWGLEREYDCRLEENSNSSVIVHLNESKSGNSVNMLSIKSIYNSYDNRVLQIRMRLCDERGFVKSLSNLYLLDYIF